MNLGPRFVWDDEVAHINKYKTPSPFGVLLDAFLLTHFVWIRVGLVRGRNVRHRPKSDPSYSDPPEVRTSSRGPVVLGWSLRSVRGEARSACDPSQSAEVSPHTRLTRLVQMHNRPKSLSDFIQNLRVVVKTPSAQKKKKVNQMP